MDTVVKKLYEGLFLVDSGEAAADWNGINDVIEKVLARGDAEIVSTRKWDERRLAYDIAGKSRGTYILVYFHGDPAKISAIERTVQLSEQIMRVLILRTDWMSKEDIEKDTPAAIVEKTSAEAEAKKNTQKVGQSGDTTGTQENSPTAADTAEANNGKSASE